MTKFKCFLNFFSFQIWFIIDVMLFFSFQFSPDALVTWDNLTGGEAGDSGIINMEDEDDDDLSDQVTI
jgi:hypothetical protein